MKNLTVARWQANLRTIPSDLCGLLKNSAYQTTGGRCAPDDSVP